MKAIQQGDCRVPKLCPRHAFLALLSCLAKRIINNLRRLNKRLKNAPLPAPL